MRYSIIFLAVGAAYAAPLAFNPLDVVVTAPDAVLAGGKVVSSEVHAVAKGGRLNPVPVGLAATGVDAVLSPVKVVDHTLHTLTSTGEHPQGHSQGHPTEHPQGHPQPHHEDHHEGHPQPHHEDHHEGHPQPHHEDHPAGHPAGHPNSHPQGHQQDHPYKSGEPTVIGVLAAGTDAVLASGGVVSHSAHHNVAGDDSKKQEVHVNPLSVAAKVPDAALAPVKVINSDLHKSATRSYPADHDIVSVDVHPHVAASPKVGPVHVGEAVGVHEKVHIGIPAGSTKGHADNTHSNSGSIDGHAVSHIAHVAATEIGHVEPVVLTGGLVSHVVHTAANKIASSPLHL